jgi:hypothetical protein
MVALEIFAGPGETAMTKNARPILNNENRPITYISSSADAKITKN